MYARTSVAADSVTSAAKDHWVSMEFEIKDHFISLFLSDEFVTALTPVSICYQCREVIS
jgi:hypothetical protein